MKTKSKAGFTLVELMVVAIIVAILAAVAIPLMTAQKRRAMATEAEAALGVLRTAMRANYAESGRYDRRPDGTDIGSGDLTNVPGIVASDLDGRYFTNSDYSIEVLQQSVYTLKAEGSRDDVADVTITLNQDGIFSRSGL